MATTERTRVFGWGDDIISFDGAIRGEQHCPNAASEAVPITLTSPAGVTLGLSAEWGPGDNPYGWVIEVTDNPGHWPVREFRSADRSEEGEGADYGVVVDAPIGTTATCGGERVL